MKLLVGKQCGLETLRFLLLSDTPKLNTATHGAAAMEILAKENGLLPIIPERPHEGNLPIPGLPTIHPESCNEETSSVRMRLSFVNRAAQRQTQRGSAGSLARPVGWLDRRGRLKGVFTQAP